MTESEIEEATEPSSSAMDARMDPGTARALRRLRNRSRFDGAEVVVQNNYHLDQSKFDPNPNDRNLEELQPGDVVVGVLCPRHRSMYRSIENRVINIGLLELCEYKASEPEERKSLRASLRKMTKKALEEIAVFRGLVEAAFPAATDDALAPQIRKGWQVVRPGWGYAFQILGREERHLGYLGSLSSEPAQKPPTPKLPKPKQVKPPKAQTAAALERRARWEAAGSPKGESHAAWLLAGRPPEWSSPNSNSPEASMAENVSAETAR